MERFACRTAVVSGDGALKALAEPGCRKMLLVTPPGTHHQALIRQAAGNPQTLVWDSPDPVPAMTRAVAGSRKIREFQPELVVALGDEGTVELGKAMVCFSRHPCRLAAVPTGIGWGGAVTDRVTLTHEGRRHLLRDETMRPDLAVLDGSLWENIPAAEIAESGFALLAAAVEAYGAVNGGMLSDLHSREAFLGCWGALPGAFAGSTQGRRRMQTAAILAGLALDQTGLGLCRAMENSLGAVFGLSRGRAAAMLLPAVVGCNAHAAGGRYAELSRAAGLGGSREELGTRNLRSGLIRLRRELGLPGTLVQAGVDLRAVWSSGRTIVALTLEDPECRNNPVAVDDFLVRRILEEITGRI